MKFAKFIQKDLNKIAITTISNLEGKFELGYDSDGELPYWDPLAELGDDEYDKCANEEVVQERHVVETTQAVATEVAVFVLEDILTEAFAWQLNMI